ncbi:hypothetical protein [Natrinema sp. DC36]|uniref:hypothetical protein n=1 Tax=Natrinema sp. DC36 TaxID=2878680 RepID=UPI001CF032E6|nr:hypothetical protein [Natrinema sp. DC36]
MSRAGWHYGSVDAVRSEGGVGGQTDDCRNGTHGCPGPDADVDALPCMDCFLEGSDNGDREVATDGGYDIDLEEVRAEIDHLVRLTSRRSQQIHLAGDASSYDEPVTLCWADERNDTTPRAFEHEHFDDELVEDRLCGNCVQKWLGLERNDGDTSKYGRTPADVLAEAGFGNGGESA